MYFIGKWCILWGVMSKHLYSSASMAQMRASPPEKLKYGGEINFIGNFGHFTAGYKGKWYIL